MNGILALVLQITQEFHKLCGEYSQVLPSELGSFEALVPSLQSPTSAVSGGVVTHSSNAHFAKELCGLLASLEAVSPGFRKNIDCVLAGKALEDMIRKVENSLKRVTIRGKRRKRRMKESFGGCLSDQCFVGRLFEDLLCIVVV
jgi:hypothetical protein